MLTIVVPERPGARDTIFLGLDRATSERGGDAAHAAYGSDNVGARYLVTKSMPECKNLALHERAAMVLELIGKSSNVLVENLV